MNDPRRLKHDPGFLAEAGNALDDEQLVVGHYDLDGLRARVVGGLPAPAGPSSWWKIAAVSGATATLVTFGLLQLQSPPPPPAPIPPPVVETIAPSPVIVPHRDVAPVELPAPEAPAAIEPPIRSERTASEPVASAPVAVETAAPDAEPAAAVPPESAPTSTLSAELADYNRAMELTEAGRWMDAHAAWETYLSRWPEGRLRTEARLGMLRALVEANRPADVERLAGQLLATPDLGAHREDLRLVRAEALVQLERCTEALSLVEGMRRSSRVGVIRSECRKAGRTP